MIVEINKTIYFCCCGCGGQVIQKYDHYLPKFISGHNSKINNPMHIKENVLKNIKAREGYTPSEETRRKISLVHKGKIISEDIRKRISEALKGRNKSEEWKRKISLVNKGKIISEETRRKISISKKTKDLTGPKCCHWRGGLSADPYCYQWLDKEYKNSIKERDGYKCLNPCCNDGRYLNIHHINYDKKDCHFKNLITVCRSCNSKANHDREWHQDWYQVLLHNRYGYNY